MSWRNLLSHTSALASLLVISVTVNVFLARKIHSSPSSRPPLAPLKIGTELPAIVGHTEDGGDVTLKYADSTVPTVLYVFTPQCGWCKKNIDNLHILINNSGPRYRIVGISLNSNGLKKYIAENKLTMPIYTDIGESIEASYHLVGTPMTLVVSPDSKLLKYWTGVYTPDTNKDIENYLKVQLPGCCKAS